MREEINKLITQYADDKITGGRLADQLLALLNKEVERERRSIVDDLDEVYFSANVANSNLSEMDRVEIKANNNAVRRCIEIVEQER